MTTLAEMMAQRAQLDAQIEAHKNAGKAAAIDQIKKLIEEFGITPNDFMAPAKPRAKASAKAPTDKRSTVAIKYRSHDGHKTWTGRGMMPRWLKTEIANGANRESFRV